MSMRTDREEGRSRDNRERVNRRPVLEQKDREMNRSNYEGRPFVLYIKRSEFEDYRKIPEGKVKTKNQSSCTDLYYTKYPETVNCQFYGSLF